MSLLLHRTYRISKQFVGLLRPRRSYFIFLFFLVLSTIFWTATTLNGYYDEEVRVPVHINGIPAGLIIATDDYDTISVLIHDKGYNLLSYGRGQTVKSLELDFSSFTRQSEKAVLNGSDLQKKLQVLFGNNSTVVSVKPDHMDLYYCQGKPKRVPILLNGKFIPSENYYLADTIIKPRMATVYGTEKTLEGIKYVTTETFTLKNYTDTVQKELKLSKISGTRIEPSRIVVKFCPDVLMEQTLDVPVTPVNVPEGMSLRTFPARVKVSFTAGVSQFKKMDKSEFVVVADFNDIREDNDKCHIRIVKRPRKVVKTRLEVDQVDYLIEGR